MRHTVSQISEREIRQIVPAQVEEPTRSAIRRAAASFWTNYLYYSATYVPWWVRSSKFIYLWWCFRYSKHIRDSTIANAARILGPDSTPRQRQILGRKMVDSIYDSVYDVGTAARLTVPQIRARVESVSGHEGYLEARKARKGVIVASAHMGSFEPAVAALLDTEKRIHIIYKRDPRSAQFERLRTGLRQRLGVVEHAIDDGWALWVELRDALAADECVVLHVDRVQPGQKGLALPLLYGHTLLPTGPIKLAIASGAPVVPAFAIRQARGNVRLFIEEPIYADESDGGLAAMEKIAATLAKFIATYPDQWLMLHPAFLEDIEPGWQPGSALATRAAAPERAPSNRTSSISPTGIKQNA
jgi:KDO2-lipid IV(A) lauroyltransferase